MGSECVVTRPRPLPKINSETNLAVQLLLAVSDGRTRGCSINISKKRVMTSVSTASSDVRADMSDDSDATECAAPSLASPNLEHKVALPIISAPKSVPSGLSRGDTTFFKYTRAERQEALQRFREKKRRRQYRKRVRYMVRKRLAETRPRYKGRFSKPPPGENYDDGTPGPSKEKSTSSNSEKETGVADSQRKSTA